MEWSNRLDWMVSCQVIASHSLARWLSEKMDGMRAFWNGSELITRHGNEIPCPDWFTEDLPSTIKLDGELWLGRGMYEDVVKLVHGENDDEGAWKSARFMVFDLPSSEKPYESRMDDLENIEFP